MQLIKYYRNFGKKKWLLLVLCFLASNGLFSFQNYMTALKNGLEVSWINLFINELPIWLIWLLLMPYILFLNQKFSLDHAKARLKNLILHISIGLIVVFVTSNIVVLAKVLNMGYLEEWTIAEYFPYFAYRFLNDLLLYSFLSIIGFAWQIYHTKRQQEVKSLQISLQNNQLNSQLITAQLQALKLQLNPHFLFNTLNTISSLTLTDKKKQSVEMIHHLSAFLRHTLANQQKHFISLEKEIEFFDLYLKIEQTRFPKRLVIKKQIDDSCLSLQVPNLLLQPLVENAIRHGIAPFKSVGEVLLVVERYRKWLLIQLWNNGKALQPNWEDRINIGLSTVIERLNKIYDQKYTFNLINRKDKTGAIAVIRIPIEIASQKFKAPKYDLFNC